jgi:hypothetical protein
MSIAARQAHRRQVAAASRSKDCYIEYSPADDSSPPSPRASRSPQVLTKVDLRTSRAVCKQQSTYASRLAVVIGTQRPCVRTSPEFGVSPTWALLDLDVRSAPIERSIEFLIAVPPLVNFLLQFHNSQALAFSICTLCGSILCLPLLMVSKLVSGLRLREVKQSCSRSKLTSFLWEDGGVCVAGNSATGRISVV